MQYDVILKKIPTGNNSRLVIGDFLRSKLIDLVHCLIHIHCQQKSLPRRSIPEFLERFQVSGA